VKVLAEQFVFPFAVDCQLEFRFIPSASVFDGWGVLSWFSWWAVLRIETFSSRRSRRPWRFAAFAAALPVIFAARRRASFCLLGLVVFR
jgi:hypothetical protein